MPDRSVLIVGVGGQGSLLASKIIGNVAIRMGYDVKVSEVHGMSQRGGSVVTYVKYSENAVSSPIIDRGEADVIIAFEPLEALRGIHYLKKGGTLLMNTKQINPMPVITGAASYPDEITGKIHALGVDNIRAVDAFSIAAEAGSEKAVNTVLMGLFAANSDISRENWDEALKETIPERLFEINKRAFDMGYAMATE